MRRRKGKDELGLESKNINISKLDLCTCESGLAGKEMVEQRILTKEIYRMNIHISLYPIKPFTLTCLTPLTYDITSFLTL